MLVDEHQKQQWNTQEDEHKAEFEQKQQLLLLKLLVKNQCQTSFADYEKKEYQLDKVDAIKKFFRRLLCEFIDTFVHCAFRDH
ncbi:unnamed protein product [Didymodactylos carnosus]|uniref:Uncharacterized protein n=1 Tax=Didymodactylos carnosus TaxID=1234261 RepID=A0A816CGI6_9BILA|nr:unnamed protein product [Didymodactylos carnosus]CAF4517433.1 unnamed protein product [Didymodactylos carnosus]